MKRNEDLIRSYREDKHIKTCLPGDKGDNKSKRRVLGIHKEYAKLTLRVK